MLVCFSIISCGKKNQNSNEIENKAVDSIKIEEKESLVRKEFDLTRNADEFNIVTIDTSLFKNKVFALGDFINKIDCSATCEGDCCSGELITFDNDFYMASYCLENDVYFKGSFEVDDERLVLIFNERFVSHEMPVEGESTIEVETMDDLNIDEVQFLSCDSNTILLIKSDQREEFGTLTSMDNYNYIEDLKKNEPVIWSKLVRL